MQQYLLAAAGAAVANGVWILFPIGHGMDKAIVSCFFKNIESLFFGNLPAHFVFYDIPAKTIKM